MKYKHLTQNGREFAGFAAIESELKIEFYFANPHHSYGNEVLIKT